MSNDSVGLHHEQQNPTSRFRLARETIEVRFKADRIKLEADCASAKQIYDEGCKIVNELLNAKKVNPAIRCLCGAELPAVGNGCCQAVLNRAKDRLLLPALVAAKLTDIDLRTAIKVEWARIRSMLLVSSK